MRNYTFPLMASTYNIAFGKYNITQTNNTYAVSTEVVSNTSPVWFIRLRLAWYT